MLSCQVPSIPTAGVIRYNLVFDKDNKPFRVGCTAIVDEWNAAGDPPSDITVLSTIDNDGCKNVNRDPQWRMQVAAEIITNLTGYSIYCDLGLGTDNRIPSSGDLKLTLDNIKG